MLKLDEVVFVKLSNTDYRYRHLFFLSALLLLISSLTACVYGLPGPVNIRDNRELNHPTYLYYTCPFLPEPPLILDARRPCCNLPYVNKEIPSASVSISHPYDAAT